MDSKGEDQKKKNGPRPRALPSWMSTADSKVAADSGSSSSSMGKDKKAKAAKNSSSPTPGTSSSYVRKFHYVMSPRELEIVARNLIQEKEEDTKKEEEKRK